jgi:hypothetical protein
VLLIIHDVLRWLKEFIWNLLAIKEIDQSREVMFRGRIGQQILSQSGEVVPKGLVLCGEELKRIPGRVSGV